MDIRIEMLICGMPLSRLVKAPYEGAGARASIVQSWSCVDRDVLFLERRACLRVGVFVCVCRSA